MRKWAVMREKAMWKVQVCTGKNSSCDEVYVAACMTGKTCTCDYVLSNELRARGILATGG
jgi:hypothetical protein